MIIDIIFFVIVILAVLKGYNQGLILGLFSLVSVLIGLAAAMKLSAVVARNFRNKIDIPEEWIPLVSFLLIFLVVVLLIRLGGKAIEKTVKTVMLGWVNKLGGIVFFIAIYITVFSVLLFYVVQMKLVLPETMKQSVTWSFIEPWGPKILNGFSFVIPVFRNVFEELQEFFGTVASKI